MSDKTYASLNTLKIFLDNLKKTFSLSGHTHSMNEIRDMPDYADTKTLSLMLNEAYSDYVLLASYDRKDATTCPEAENFTLTFSESINNFAMIFICVRTTTYIMGSSFIPVAFFKSGIQFELNCMNDIEKTYHGNIKYLTDTTATGKISGYTGGFEVYGFLRIA